MTLKKVTLGDGRNVLVDAKRLAVWDSFAKQNASAMRDAHLIGDSGDSALYHFINQMTYLEEVTFKRQYIPTQAQELVPMDFRGGEHIDSVTYKVYDGAGLGRRKATGSGQVHTTAGAYALKTFPVVSGEQGYGYDTEELRKSAFMRQPVNEDKMVEAVEAYNRHINLVALFGEGELTGLFNNALVSNSAVANFTGNWANPSTAAANILSDINTAINTVHRASGFNDYPTHLVVPSIAYSALVSRQLPNTQVSVLEYLMKNNICSSNQRPFQIVSGYGLDSYTGSSTAGSGGGNTRALYFVKNPLRVVMEIPLPQRFLAPQLVNFSVLVPGEYKYSGVEYRYPTSALYQDGV